MWLTHAILFTVVLYCHSVATMIDDVWDGSGDRLQRLINGGLLVCTGRSIPDGGLNPDDCSRAREMIPTGRYTFDVHRQVQESRGPVDPERPISLTFDKRKILFPAAFMVRTCVILVKALPRPQQEAGQSASEVPVNAATAMTFTVWPNVRKLGKTLIKACVSDRRVTGYVNTKSMLGDWAFRYQIVVARSAGPVGWLDKFHIYYNPHDGPLKHKRRKPTQEGKRVEAQRAAAATSGARCASKASPLNEPGSIGDGTTRTTEAACRATAAEAARGRRIGCIGGLLNKMCMS